MPHKLSRCKTLLALTTWACACVALLLVWPPLPAPAPPLPATSPRPKHTPTPKPPFPPGLSHRVAITEKGRSEWRVRGRGGPRLYREEEEDEEYEEEKDRIVEYYDDDGDDDDSDNDARLKDESETMYNKSGRDDVEGPDSGDNMERRINRNKYKEIDNEGKRNGAKKGERMRGEYRGNKEISTNDKNNVIDTKTYENEYEEILERRKGGNENKEQEEEYYLEEEQEEEKYDVDEVEYTGGQYNITPHDARLLIYNRIPKCASSTMQTILRWCSRRLGYDHVSSLVYDQHQLSPQRQRELVNNLTIKTSSSGTLSYDQHLYYTDFAKQGAERPVYINLVREPVERFISSFYYRRSKERLARILAHGHLIASPSPNWRNRTVEQCVLAGDPECSFSVGDMQEMVLTYFCGHQPSCRMVGSKAALQQAKQVVSEEYSVVGLVAHMEVSLRLMETLIPGYLTGALQSYYNIKRKEKVNKNSHKPTVSKEVRDELRRRMAHDIDFYNFLKQRLFLQRQTFLGK